MEITTKGDLVNAALRKLGIASDATLTDVEPQSVIDGVDDLEVMMADWYQDGSGIITGYRFAPDDTPVDAGDEHGLSNSEISAVTHNLALRIAPDYGVTPTQKLMTTARYGKEQLVRKSAMSRAKKANVPGSRYPNRMPVGSGNRGLTLAGQNYFYHYEEE